jgi:signal transduction histidine kinase/ActR/RegA family two-component response regulator
MKTLTIFSAAVNFFTKANVSGNSLLQPGLKKKTQLLNNLKIILCFTTIVYFANTVNNYFSDFKYSLGITGISTLFFIFLRLVVNERNFVTARNLFMATTCISLGFVCFTEGFVSGNYFFFFVFVIVASFIYDYKETNQLIAAFIVILVSVVIIFLYTPNHSILQPQSLEMEDFYFKSNLIFTAILICILSFILLRQNFDNAKRVVGKQKFLDAIFNTSFDAVFIVNTKSYSIDNCNSQSYLIFDTDKNAIFSKPFDTFFKGEDVVFNKFTEAVKSKSLNWKGELICKTNTGAEFVGLVSVVSFFIGQEVFKKINILDITDIKKIQIELSEAKEKAESAMKTKTQFLSHMSHELRTPLNAIIGTSNLLLDEERLEMQEEHLQMLKNSSEHMLHLVNDVLDYSKIEADMMKLEKNTFNGKEFFDKIQGMFQNQFNKKGLCLKMEIDEALHKNFITDETKLSQILCNLISNALKFTEEGDVTVSAKLEKSTSKKAQVLFSVKDSGIGISKKHQDLVFLSFTQADKSTTRKFGGTGLGLSISKKMVELLKGDLKINSKLGSGCEFYFTIPLGVSLNNKQYVNEKTMKTLHTLDTLNVLIAEDNGINMMIVRKFLNKWSIQPTEAVNGVEAIQKFDKEKHDVLLIDLEMPEMDGYETIAEIRKTNKDIPVIAFTAAMYDNMHSDLLSHGFTDYIQKPFRPEDLHGKIAQYIKQAV